MHRTWTWSIFTLCLVAWGCKPKPPVPSVPPPPGVADTAPEPPAQEEELAASKLAKEADTLERRGDQSGAAQKRSELAETYPGTGAAAEVWLETARESETEQPNEAIDAYEKVLFYRPSHPERRAINLAYARLLIAVGRHHDAAQQLAPLYDSAPANAKLSVGETYGKALRQAGRRGEAVRLLGDLRAYADSTQAKAFETTAVDIVTESLNLEQANSLWQDIGDNGDFRFLHPVLAYRLAKVHYHTRSFEQAKGLLELIGERYRNSEFAASAAALLERLNARFEVNPRKVGVLLPLSGRWQLYGERALAAIELAMGDKSDIQLVVRDTGGDAGKAELAVQELVLKEHAIALLGPLSSKASVAAAHKAEELSVPIVVLSHRAGLPEIGPYVFRAALTVRAQAEALAKTGFEKLGFTRFAMMAPRSSYGRQFAEAFWDAVDRRKGEIRAIEYYEHDQTTFREPVRRMVGRWYMLARPEFLMGKRKIESENHSPSRKNRLFEELEKSVAPVIDFEAIVIPDQADTIGLIAPALAVEDIVMTHDPDTLKTIRKATGRPNLQPITLMGASTWNDKRTVTSCQRYCEDSVFVDAYFSDNPSARMRDFVSAFKGRSGADPDLKSAEAFDAAGMLRELLVKPGAPRNRNNLRDRLATTARFDGVCGTMSFDSNGEAQKSLLELTIKNGTIQLWEAPKSQ